MEAVIKIVISNSSDEPIYQQIVSQIKESILKGDLAAGEALPSIRSLAKDLQISVITTKRAYEELEKEGFIDTVAGKGSFVAVHNKEILKEKRLAMVESKLIEAIITAKALELSLNDLKEMLEVLYKEV